MFQGPLEGHRRLNDRRTARVVLRLAQRSGLMLSPDGVVAMK
jgi:hypothetical protein